MCGASTSRNKPRCRSWCSNSRQKKSHFVKHSTLQRGQRSVPFQTPHAYLNVPRNSDVFLTTRVTPLGHGEALFVRSFCSTGKIVPCIENQLMKTSTTNGRHLFHGLDRGVGKTVCQHSGVSIPQLICQSFLRWHNIFTAMSSLLANFSPTHFQQKRYLRHKLSRKKRTPDYLTKFVRIC